MNFTFYEVLSIMIILALIINIVLIIRIEKDRREFDKDKIESLRRLNFSKGKQDILDYLNTFIEDCIHEYTLKNITIDAGITYINSDMETKIRDSVKEMVTNRISDLAIEKLSIFFNKDAIGTVIAENIFLMVSTYVITFNDGSDQKANDNAKKKKDADKIKSVLIPEMENFDDTDW